MEGKRIDWVSLVIALMLGALAGGILRNLGYGTWTVVLGVLVGAALCAFALKIFRMLMWKRKNGPFIRAYNKVVNDHQNREPKDYQAFYEGLISIKEEPQSVESEAAYALSLSSALYFLGNKKGALEALDQVPIYNKEVGSIVRQQREHMKSGKLKA